MAPTPTNRLQGFSPSSLPGPLIVDIGGEGRYPQAWNINPRELKTLGPQRGQPIPRHIRGRADRLPLPSGSVDLVIVERTPLSRNALHEIVRVVSPDGFVILRHAPTPNGDSHELAKQIIPGFVSQQIVRLGNQSVQESVFCQNFERLDQLQTLLLLASEDRS